MLNRLLTFTDVHVVTHTLTHLSTQLLTHTHASRSPTKITSIFTHEDHIDEIEDTARNP